MSRSAACIHVPASWSGAVVLRPPGEEAWAAVRVAGAPVRPEAGAGGWLIGSYLAPGRWNELEVEEGAVAGARLTVHPLLHISRLEAFVRSGDRLALRAALSCEGNARLFFTLSAPDGRQIGMLEAEGGDGGVLTAETALPTAQPGVFRLKATLYRDDQVLDNARIDLEIGALP